MQRTSASNITSFATSVAVLTWNAEIKYVKQIFENQWSCDRETELESMPFRNIIDYSNTFKIGYSMEITRYPKKPFKYTTSMMIIDENVKRLDIFMRSDNTKKRPSIFFRCNPSTTLDQKNVARIAECVYNADYAHPHP